MLGTPCRAPELITSANYCLAGKIGVGWGTEIPRIFYTKLIQFRVPSKVYSTEAISMQKDTKIELSSLHNSMETINK